MKKHITIAIIILFSTLLLINCKDKQHKSAKPDYVIVIHGGAGNSSNKDINAEQQEEYKQKLAEALSIGEEILKNNGTCIEAIESTINFLENCPLFNAGKGAVFTHDGKNELDASIMNGADLNAGAVAGVTDIKNPISAAIKVMTHSEHVLLTGKGASKFARDQNLEMADSSYFYTKPRWESLQRALKSEKYGTVGCVVLDKFGNLAAGTSTGGRTNKKYGRVGDSPIIGAGTYANNNTCAISATGHGEYFIRYAVAHDISALMEYKGMSITEAADLVINKKLVEAGGSGGIIGVDQYGNIATTFNTNMMFRAYVKSNGERKIAIFK